MAFCLRCGAPLAERAEGDRQREACTRCDWIHYRNPVPAAAAIVPWNGGVLLVLRSFEPAAGAWCLHVGFQEIDESLEEACMRETREETGMDVSVTRLHGLYDGRDDPRNRVVLAVYETEVRGGKLQAGDDAREVRAFDLSRLPESIAFQNHRRVLADLRARAMC